MSDRTERARHRRQIEDLIDQSSLGTEGAKALRKAGSGGTLSSEEKQAAADELRELEK